MTPKSVLIVSHCWCPAGTDLYAQHLKWQIASMFHNPPPVPTRLLICRTFPNDDRLTDDMIGLFCNIPTEPRWPDTLKISILELPREELFRRAIGRNCAALGCTESIVWFCDLDYCFGSRCLEALADQVGPDDELCWPEEVLVNVDHATGDKMVWDNRDVMLPRIDPSLFVPLKRDRAIGGLQICGGNVARQRGYLDGTKWVEPVDVSKGFHQTDEDPKFRRGRKARPIQLPNLYWIRHSFKGAWVA